LTVQHSNGWIEFRFYRPAARRARLVGDFNGWGAELAAMTRCEGGWWRLQCMLAPGTYHFLYQTEDGWYPDYAAFGLTYGPFGWNSVLHVDAPEARAAADEPEELIAASGTIDLLEPAGNIAQAGAGKPVLNDLLLVS
jgi:1,4-alpha-glucan branching enzyme